MSNKLGKATYRHGKLYFDAAGWATIKAAAKRLKKSPTQVVNAALMRSIKRGLFEKTEKS